MPSLKTVLDGTALNALAYGIGADAQEPGRLTPGAPMHDLSSYAAWLCVTT